MEKKEPMIAGLWQRITGHQTIKKLYKHLFFFTALSCESSFEAQDFKDAAQVKKVAVVHATW